MANLFEKLSFSVPRPSATEERIVSNGVTDSVESNAWSSGQVDERREVNNYFSPLESRPPPEPDKQPVCKPVTQEQTDGKLSTDVIQAVKSAAGNDICQNDITKRLTCESDSGHSANDPAELTAERRISPVEKEPSCEKSLSDENLETKQQCPKLASTISEKLTDTTEPVKVKTFVFQQTAPCTVPTEPKSTNPVSNSIPQQDNSLPLPCDSEGVSKQLFSVTLKKPSTSGVKLKFKKQSKCKKTESTTVTDEQSAKEPKNKHAAKREKKHSEVGTAKTSSGVTSKKSSKSKTKSAKRERNSGSTDAKAAHLPLSKPFIIPRKKSKQGLFQEVTLDSREFLKDILPILTTQYRSKDASNRFTFTRAQLVHNEELTKSFIEWRKDMKDEGRTDKELTESFAFISTDSEKEAQKMCQEGLSANGSHSAVLGNPSMGVYLSRYSDILKRDGLEPGHKGILLILKILKGKVKAVPLNYSSMLDPMPNFDSHVAKSNAVDMNRLTSLQTPVAYDATRIYLYEFGDLDMVTRPRQICPYAMVHFTYQEPVKSTQPTQGMLSSLHETRNPAAQSLTQAHHHSTPPQALPVSTPAQSATPHGDTHAAAPEVVHKTVSAPTLKYNLLRERHFVVWKGVLTAKEEPLCIGKMVSYTSPVLPHTLPSSLNFKNKISFAKMLSYFPSGIFASGIPLTSDIREVCRRNKYVVYCELQQIKESHKRFEHLLHFLMREQVVLKCSLGNGVMVFVLPTSQLSQKLGLTKGDYPDTLHVLFTSHLPMIGHITEKGICMPPGSKIQRPISDNQLLEKSSNKQLMLRIGLLSMFTRQSHDLKRRQATEIPTMPPQLEVSESQASSVTLSSSSTTEQNVTVIDYKHGISSRKDLVSTYKKSKQDLTDGLNSAQPPKKPPVPARSRLTTSVHSVHPMYSSPSGLELKSDVNPEASFHPMYNISAMSPSIAKESMPNDAPHPPQTPQMPHKTSETLPPTPKEGTPKAAPHPMYSPQPELDRTTSETTPGTQKEKMPQVSPHPMYMSPFKEAAPQDKVHPMYSQHIEVTPRGDPGTPLMDEAFSPRSAMRDPRLANGHPHAHYQTPLSTNDYQRRTDISGVQKEPPKVSRSSNMEFGSILDKQQEIKKLKEEMKILRQLKENTIGDQGLEQLYNTKLTKLQDILAALRQERNRLNQPQAGGQAERQPLSNPPLGVEMRHPQVSEEHQGQDPSLEGSRTKSLGYVGEERGKQPSDQASETERELGRQTVPTTPEMKDNSSAIQTPTLSTRLADSTVIPVLSKKGDLSIETLKAVIVKVLYDPNQPTNEKVAAEEIEGSKDTPSSFPVSIPLSMLSAEKAFEAKSKTRSPSGSSQDGSSRAGPEATVKAVHSESATKEKSGSKRPVVAFDEALASMDNYTHASKKLKKSHSRNSELPPVAASALPKTPSKSSGTKGVEEEKNTESDGSGTLEESFPKDEIQNSQGMESFIERFNKDGLVLDINSAKRMLSNQEGRLGSPIHGASEMKAFLNVGVKSSSNRIISATEMSSYLNKKLVEVEREKRNRGKKGGTPAGRGKGANSRERTIAEIDAEIKRLNKEKERLKSVCPRKRHSSGGSHSDKPEKLSFINSVDLRGLGRIPKKKTPSLETVKGAPGPTQQVATKCSLADAMQEEETLERAVGIVEDVPEDIASMVSNSHHKSPKPCFLICSKEIQLRGGKDKALLETGFRKNDKPLVVMVLTRKYLQAGMKECDWSGLSLQDCVRDILHVKSRYGESSETEQEIQFSQNAQAAVRIVFTRQRMVAEPIGRQVTENNQTVTFNSSTGEKSVNMHKTPSGSIDKDQDLINTDQVLEIPGGEIKNGPDQVLMGGDKLSALKKQESPEEAVHIEDRSQEGQSKNLESTSTSLGEGAKGSGSLSADCEQELDKAVERPLKDTLIINDGACFFGDLESEEGVSVEMKLDEEAATGDKSPTEVPHPDEKKSTESLKLPVLGSSVSQETDVVDDTEIGEKLLTGSSPQTKLTPYAAKAAEILPRKLPSSLSPQASLALSSKSGKHDSTVQVKGLDTEIKVKELGNTKSDSTDESVGTEKPIDVTMSDGAVKDPSQSTSCKSAPSFKESRASRRHHPYERRKEMEESGADMSYSKRLVVPELEKLMQNYTIAAYKDRKRNRHHHVNEPDFFSSPRNDPARFKNVSKQFSRSSQEHTKEEEQQGDVKSLASKLQKKKEKLSEMEREMSQGGAKSEEVTPENREEAFQAEQLFYEEQVEPSPACKAQSQDQPDASISQASGRSLQPTAQRKTILAATTTTAGACQGGIGLEVLPDPAINSTISNPSLTIADDNNSSTASCSNNSSSSSNGSSNNCSSSFTDNYSSSNSSSHISYRDNSTCNSSSSSNSISNSSSVSNSHSSEVLAGAGGGSSASHTMGGGDHQSQHINTIPTHQFSSQLALNTVPTAANMPLNRVNTLGSSPVHNQHYIPAKPATSKGSCLVSCSINVSRDPRIMRKHSQSDPSKTPQQSESPASATPSAATTQKQSHSSSTVHASSSAHALPKEKRTKSILKGSQKHSIDSSTEKENCLSGPSIEQDSTTDASKKVKISLLEYKGKGRQPETPGTQEVDPSLDVRQVALSPSCSNIQVTVTGDTKRTLMLEEIDSVKPKKEDEIFIKAKQDAVASDEVRNPPHREEKLLTVQICKESDSRVVVDRSISPPLQHSLLRGEVRMISKTSPTDNTFLRDQPNLLITIPRDDMDEPKDTLLKPIENVSKIVKHQSKGEVNSSIHVTDTNAPEVSKKHEMSLENSVTIALLELEDAIFNISADTIADIKTRQSYLGEHLAKLSPTSVSRRLQDIKYELDAFWSELRTLDLPESLQVTEAVPCDPRCLSLNRQPFQNGEVNGDDLTAHTINDIMMDITSKMTYCLESDTVPRKQHEKMMTCFSTHLPKLVKLTGVLASPRNSPENVYVHSDQMDVMISGMKQDMERKVEDLYSSVIDHFSPKEKVQTKSEMPEFSSKPDIPLIVQQLLTAARARSFKTEDTSSNMMANFFPIEAHGTKVTFPSVVDYNQNDSLPPEPPTKEHDTNASSWKLVDNRPSTKPRKNTEFKPSKVELRLSPERSPVRHVASSTKLKRKKVVTPATPDSCKWGKFTMKLWGKRPKKPGKPEKAKTSNTSSPEPLHDTSATNPSTDATSENIQDTTDATREEPSDTQTVTEKKLSSDDEKAVEDMCAKLLGEDDKKKEEPVTGTGIPTLLNRSTSHASSALKRSYASTPTSSKESTHQAQTTWPTVQASSHNTGSNQQQAFNPVVAHQNLTNQTYPYSHQTMTQQQPCAPQTQNTTGYMQHQTPNFQYNNGSQGCVPYQGYPQQPQGNSNMMMQPGQASQGFMQRAPNNVPFGPQQNTNCVQQQYNLGYGYSGNLMQSSMGPGQYNMGYGTQNSGTGMAGPCPEGHNGGQQLFNMGGNNMGYGSSGQMNSNMGPVTTNIAPGLNNMGHGPTNMAPGPNNMGPGPINMGPSSANIGPGPVNMGPGPTNMGPGPTNMGPGPTNMGPGPTNMGPGPTNMGPGPTNMGPGPTNMGPGPTNMGPGPTNMGPGPTNMGPGPTNMGPGPTNMGPGPTNMGPGPTNMGPGPTNMGPGPINMGPGPNNMGPGQPNIGPSQTNVGPRPYMTGPGPIRQQPPVPGIDSEGIVNSNSGVHLSAGQYSNYMYNVNFYACYSQLYYTNPFVYMSAEDPGSIAAPTVADFDNKDLEIPLIAIGEVSQATLAVETKANHNVKKDESKMVNSDIKVDSAYRKDFSKEDKIKMTLGEPSTSKVEIDNMDIKTCSIMAAETSSERSVESLKVTNCPKNLDKTEEEVVAVGPTNTSCSSTLLESFRHVPEPSQECMTEHLKVDGKCSCKNFAVEEYKQDVKMIASPASSRKENESNKSAVSSEQNDDCVDDLSVLSMVFSSEEQTLTDDPCESIQDGRQDEEVSVTPSPDESISFLPLGVEHGVMTSFLNDEVNKPRSSSCVLDKLTNTLCVLEEDRITSGILSSYKENADEAFLDDMTLVDSFTQLKSPEKNYRSRESSVLVGNCSGIGRMESVSFFGSNDREDSKVDANVDEQDVKLITSPAFSREEKATSTLTSPGEQQVFCVEDSTLVKMVSSPKEQTLSDDCNNVEIIASPSSSRKEIGSTESAVRGEQNEDYVDDLSVLSMVFSSEEQTLSDDCNNVEIIASPASPRKQSGSTETAVPREQNDDCVDDITVISMVFSSEEQTLSDDCNNVKLIASPASSRKESGSTESAVRGEQNEDCVDDLSILSMVFSSEEQTLSDDCKNVEIIASPASPRKQSGSTETAVPREQNDDCVDDMSVISMVFSFEEQTLSEDCNIVEIIASPASPRKQSESTETAVPREQNDDCVDDMSVLSMVISSEEQTLTDDLSESIQDSRQDEEVSVISPPDEYFFFHPRGVEHGVMTSFLDDKVKRNKPRLLSFDFDKQTSTSGVNKNEENGKECISSEKGREVKPSQIIRVSTAPLSCLTVPNVYSSKGKTDTYKRKASIPNIRLADHCSSSGRMNSVSTLNRDKWNAKVPFQVNYSRSLPLRRHEASSRQKPKFTLAEVFAGGDSDVEGSQSTAEVPRRTKRFTAGKGRIEIVLNKRQNTSRQGLSSKFGCANPSVQENTKRSHRATKSASESVFRETLWPSQLAKEKMVQSPVVKVNFDDIDSVDIDSVKQVVTFVPKQDLLCGRSQPMPSGDEFWAMSKVGSTGESAFSNGKQANKETSESSIEPSSKFGKRADTTALAGNMTDLTDLGSSTTSWSTASSHYSVGNCSKSKSRESPFNRSRPSIMSPTVKAGQSATVYSYQEPSISPDHYVNQRIVQIVRKNENGQPCFVGSRERFEVTPEDSNKAHLPSYSSEVVPVSARSIPTVSKGSLKEGRPLSANQKQSTSSPYGCKSIPRHQLEELSPPLHYAASSSSLSDKMESSILNERDSAVLHEEIEQAVRPKTSTATGKIFTRSKSERSFISERAASYFGEKLLDKSTRCPSRENKVIFFNASPNTSPRASAQHPSSGLDSIPSIFQEDTWGQPCDHQFSAAQEASHNHLLRKRKLVFESPCSSCHDKSSPWSPQSICSEPKTAADPSEGDSTNTTAPPRNLTIPKHFQINQIRGSSGFSCSTKAQQAAGHLHSRSGHRKRNDARPSTAGSFSDTFLSVQDSLQVSNEADYLAKEKSPPSGCQGRESMKGDCETGECGEEPVVDTQEKASLEGGQGGIDLLSMGIVVPDELLLMTCCPDDLGALCSRLMQRSSINGEKQWKLLLGSEIVVKMDQVRQHLPVDSQLGRQAYRILKVLSTYHGLGVVQLLPCKNTYHGAMTVQNQIDYIHELRLDVPNVQQCHCVFLSDVNPESAEVILFRKSNIDVCNMTLLNRVVASTSTDQPQGKRNTQHGYTTLGVEGSGQGRLIASTTEYPAGVSGTPAKQLCKPRWE